MKEYSKPKQDGIATVLIVLLIGISLTAATLGTVRFVGSAQEKNMAFHARTMAQARAWGAADLIAGYLKKVSDDPGPWKLFYENVNDADVTEKNNNRLRIDLAGLDVSANIVNADLKGSPVIIEVEIVSRVAVGTRAEATESLSLQFQVIPPSGGAPPVPYSSDLKGVSIMGDLKYTGGGMDVLGGVVNLSGNLTISNGSAAGVQTCAKGNITVSGGGIKAGGKMLSEGSIKFSNMTAPTNATIIGRDIDIVQTGGSYVQIRAGAFIADVVSNNSVIGRSVIGGERVFSSSTGTLTNVITQPQSGHAWIALNSGSDFVMRLAEFDGNNAASASLRLSKTGSIPDQVQFLFNSGNNSFNFNSDVSGTADRCGISPGGVCGGSLKVVNTVASEVWGNVVGLGGSSTGGGNYTLLKANSEIVTGGRSIEVGSLRGGGNILPADLTNINQANALIVPTVEGKIVGEVKMTSGTVWPNTIPKLTRNVPSAAGGLPGLPYCDLRPRMVDVDGLTDEANFLFYFNKKDNRPELCLRNMLFKKGGVVPETPTGCRCCGYEDQCDCKGYDLGKDDVRLIPGGTAAFMLCGWQNDPNNNSAHCFRNSDKTSLTKGWHLNGVGRFPAGIAWFDRMLTIEGVSATVSTTEKTLFNTFLAKGDVYLTSSGHGPLKSPNFGSDSDICGGDFYPANLCENSGGTARLVRWMDKDGVERTGTPLGNVAIASEGALDAQGWEISGSAILGAGLSTGGSTTKIYGSVAVGGNQPSGLGITAGGIVIDLSTVSEDQLILPWPEPETDGVPSGPSAQGSVNLGWVRYQ